MQLASTPGSRDVPDRTVIAWYKTVDRTPVLLPAAASRQSTTESRNEARSCFGVAALAAAAPFLGLFRPRRT